MDVLTNDAFHFLAFRPETKEKSNIIPMRQTKTTFSVLMSTFFQVDGKEAVSKLRSKFQTRGFSVLYHGSLAAFSATAVGHFPWFYTYNSLQEYLPRTEDPLKKLGRNALIGFLSSLVSDTSKFFLGIKCRLSSYFVSFLLETVNDES